MVRSPTARAIAPKGSAIARLCAAACQSDCTRRNGKPRMHPDEHGNGLSVGHAHVKCNHSGVREHSTERYSSSKEAVWHLVGVLGQHYVQVHLPNDTIPIEHWFAHAAD
jgi:hypothetical protein